VLPHLDSAYNLARRLIRNDHDAEDLVQEARLRAVKSFGETPFLVVPWGAELSVIEEALRALLGIAEPTDELRNSTRPSSMRPGSASSCECSPLCVSD